MKFAIFNEIESGGKKKRKFLVEWSSERIIAEIQEEYDKIAEFDSSRPFVLAAIRNAFNLAVENFKKESIKIP